jgi:hypothetical protein
MPCRVFFSDELPLKVFPDFYSLRHGKYSERRDFDGNLQSHLELKPEGRLIKKPKEEKFRFHEFSKYSFYKTSVRSFIIATIDDIMAIRKLIMNRYDTRNTNNINILRYR